MAPPQLMLPALDASHYAWPSDLEARGIMKRAVMQSASGLQLARFTFHAARPSACAVLVHGFTVSARFELLAADADGVHNCWEGSLLERLVSAGVTCYAYDQQSHGESEGALGAQAFFKSFDSLADDALQLCNLAAAEQQGLPLLLVGLSMGGAVAVRVSRSAMRTLCDAIGGTQPPIDS